MARIVSGTAGEREVVHALRNGDIVGLPTETVYGLAADMRNDDAIRRIFTVKGRPTSHPLIAHIARFDQLEELSQDLSETCRLLVSVCWPGPLTVIVRAAPGMSRVCTGGRDTVAVRMPAHEMAQRVITELGTPVVAPSANRFGHVSPTSAQHVDADIGEEIDLILDGGPCDIGVESTIVDCTTSPLQILRHGAITPEDVRRIVDSTSPAGAGDSEISLQTTGPSRAPGMMERHYAPHATLVLHDDVGTVPADGAPLLRFDDDVVEAARVLYQRLRELDDRHIPLAHVVLPAARGLGYALRDRLTKAAAGL
jgi:L-threonylcarbamoyladenylate synthase